MNQREFNVGQFAINFKNIIDWMLENEHGNQIKNDIQFFKNNKDELNRNHDSPKALRTIIELIVTQAWYYKTPQTFNEKVDSFLTKHGQNFRTHEARRKIIIMVQELAPPRIIDQAKERIRKLLDNYPTIKSFTEELYNSAKQEKANEVLGEKGRDNYLRDYGYWDRIPMDRHEMRFIIRTGIYHACSVKNEGDPLQKSALHNTLAHFCSVYLKEKVIDGIELANSPGVVDIFIWSYCGRDRYNICGSTPKCDECSLKETCLYFLMNTA